MTRAGHWTAFLGLALALRGKGCYPLMMIYGLKRNRYPVLIDEKIQLLTALEKNIACQGRSEALS